MRVVCTLSPACERALKRLERRYPGVARVLDGFVKAAPFRAQSHPTLTQLGGIPIRKGRAPNPDANRGKSYGFRVIYAMGRGESDPADTVRLLVLYIYDKAEQPDITQSQRDSLVAEMREELHSLRSP